MNNSWRLLLLGSVAFAIAHTQSPLYYSNQNQYFLAGLADSEFGELKRDWLANTINPVPLFSTFVELSYRFLGEWPFQVVYFLVLMVYFFSLGQVTLHLVPALRDSPRMSLWMCLIILVHSGLARYGCLQLLGQDYLWFLQCGLANQYILGPGLQPSTFGVGILTGIWFVLRKQLILAALVLGTVTIIHATYLLPVGMLAVGLFLYEMKLGSSKQAEISLGVIACLLLGVAYFQSQRFYPDDPTIFQEANRILAELRIPHHCVPARWFDEAGAFQVAWLILGGLLLRHTAMFPTYLIAMILASIGTIAVLITNDPTLSLLFPWRVTAVLIPIATAVIFGRFTVLLPEWRFWRTFGILGGVAAIASGFAVYHFGLGYHESKVEDDIMEYIQSHPERGATYLIPCRLPEPSNKRGVYSNTFAPPPAPDKVPFFELARFRLATGMPIYVDFKSIPYHAKDVLEWVDRVRWVEAIYTQPNWDERSGEQPSIITQVRDRGISHVIVPNKLTIVCQSLEPIYDGSAYRIYQVIQAK